MTVRTSTRTVTFGRPFALDGFDETLPAGDYTVETEEELLDGLSFPAWRRVLTLLHLRVASGRPGLGGSLTIDPTVLEAALRRDREVPLPALASGRGDAGTNRHGPAGPSS
ncbi:MAG: hypothetical protein AB7N54_18775 [Alphaproteobacteria bacterium]